METVDRVESGPIQFDDDWPGIFLRGDDAAFFALAIESALHNPNSQVGEMAVAIVRGFTKLLRMCQVNGPEWDEASLQKIRHGG